MFGAPMAARRAMLKLLTDPKAEAEALSLEDLVAMADGNQTEDGSPTETEQVAVGAGVGGGKRDVAMKPIKPHAKGPAMTTGEPDDDDRPRPFSEELQPIMDRDADDKDMSRAALILKAKGGAANATTPQQLNQQFRGLAGKDVKSTPENAQAALDKYLRFGSGMPSVSQLAALGKTREEVEQMRVEKVLQRRGRKGIMGLDEE